MIKEPLVLEEQGVVYLFSKYWKRINSKEKLNIKEITKVGSRFPDIEYYDNKYRLGGIELENDLSGFRSHMEKKKKGKKIDLKQFYEDSDVKVKAQFIVIYWNEDDDPQEIKKQFEEKVNNKSTIIKLVNLKEYFLPIVTKSIVTKPFRAYWQFCPNKKTSNKAKKKTYSCDEIYKELQDLPKKNWCSLPSSEKIYCIIGFNMKKKTAGIDYLHWKQIHFFTFKRFKPKLCPSYVFMIPTGSKRIGAMLKIKALS